MVKRNNLAIIAYFLANGSGMDWMELLIELRDELKAHRRRKKSQATERELDGIPEGDSRPAIEYPGLFRYGAEPSGHREVAFMEMPAADDRFSTADR